MGDDPFVEAFEPGREERQPLLACEPLDGGLVELPALRRQGDHPVLGDAAVDRIERGRNDVHAQHHPGAPSVGIVVHLACAQGGRVPVVEESQVEATAEDGGDRTLLGEPAEGVRQEGENV